MREQLDTLRDQATQSGLDLHLVSKALDGPARLSTGLGFTVQEAGNRNNWMSVLFSSREDADHARAVMMEALKTAISIQLIQAENLTPHPSQFFRARPPGVQRSRPVRSGLNVSECQVRRETWRTTSSVTCRP